MSNRVIDILPPAKPRSAKLPARNKNDSSPSAGQPSFSRSLKKASGKPRAQEPVDVERADAAKPRKDVKRKQPEPPAQPDESSPAEMTLVEGEDPRAAESQSDSAGNATVVAPTANAAAALSTTDAASGGQNDETSLSVTTEAKKSSSAGRSARVSALVSDVSETDSDADAALVDELPIDDQPAEIAAAAMTEVVSNGNVDAEPTDPSDSPGGSLTSASLRKSAEVVDSLVPEEPASNASPEAAMSATATDAGASDADQQSFDAQEFTLDAEASADAPKSAGEKIGGAEAFGAMLTRAAEARPSSSLPAAPTTGGAEQVFADANHPQIISHVRQELLPTGGTMRIRLDPPELGALQVTVHMRDGLVTASFETSNDQATRLLSHSMHQLKQSLEAQGVVVERMQVQQSPRGSDLDNGASGRDGGDQRQQSAAEQHSARQEQQRREMMQRLWQRLSGSDDYVDLVA